MIEYTVLDYEGEPVTIEDGEILEYEPDVEEDEEEDEVDYPRHKYHDWYDCNTDWRSW